MTETAVSPITSVMTPSTPQFQALKDVLDKLTLAKSELEKAQSDVDSLSLEANTIAKSIVESGISDEHYELAPTFEMKSMEKVDSNKLKELHPDIFERSNPHIDNHGIAAILKKAHGEAQLQSMMRDLDPVMYLEKATVTKPAVKKACTKEQFQSLQNDGCLFITTTCTGEVGIINKHVRDEYNRLHAPKRDDDSDDWDAEDDA